MVYTLKIDTESGILDINVPNNITAQKLWKSKANELDKQQWRNRILATFFRKLKKINIFCNGTKYQSFEVKEYDKNSLEGQISIVLDEFNLKNLE